MASDASTVLVDGPWEHRYVAANGARFHVATLGEGPLVLFLHAFPQFWWSWRHQLAAVAAAGYRGVAMDLRGYGASDKPPQGYEAPNLAADVAGVVRSLGETDAVVIGHGIGGWLTWSLPLTHPGIARAIGVVATPHPATIGVGALRPPVSRGALAVLGLARPFHPEREMARGPAYVHRILRSWAPPGAPWPPGEDAARYAAAMAIPFAAHSAAEAYRWLLRAPLHPAGRAYLRSLRSDVDVPVLGIHGLEDPVISPLVTELSATRVRGHWTVASIPGAGHCPHEERPDEVNDALTTWLAALP